jgi:hypothetical protein
MGQFGNAAAQGGLWRNRIAQHNQGPVGNRTYGLTEAEIAVVDGADCAPRTDWRTDQTAL